MISPSLQYRATARTLGGMGKAEDEIFLQFRRKYWDVGASVPRQESLRGKEPLLQGKIYTYEYNPKTKDILAFYDVFPIMLSLGLKREPGSEGPLNLGINLNFVPPRLRAKLLDLIFNKFRGQINDNLNRLNRGVSGQVQLPVDYRLATALLENTGFEFALRSYYRHRMSRARVIDYEDWHWLLFLSTERTAKESLSNIHALYNQARRRERERFKGKRRQR